MPLIDTGDRVVPELESVRLPAGPRLILPAMLMAPLPARVMLPPWQIMLPLIVVVPAPTTVSVLGPAEILPPSVKLPASEPIAAAPDRVMGLAKVFVPLIFSMAPLPAGPEPLIVIGSAVV